MSCRSLKVTLVLAAVLITANSVAAQSKTELMRNTVAATHRVVQNMEQVLATGLGRLNESTAELLVRIEESDREVRKLLSVVEENQMKLEQLQLRLDSLTTNLYRHLELSPPGAADFIVPNPQLLPPQDITRDAPVEVETGGVVIQPPTTVEGQAPVGQAPPQLIGTSVRTAEADTQYRRARSLYDNDEYALALEQFDAYLVLFPGTVHEPNAQYWKAHCYFNTGDYQTAITEFRKLQDFYPSSVKVPSAMFNEAVSYSRLRDNERAVAIFQALVSRYPEDIASERARAALTQLQGLE